MLQRFERSNAIEIRNGIVFDFYPGLPHMYIVHTIYTQYIIYTHMYYYIHTCT